MVHDHYILLLLCVWDMDMVLVLFDPQGASHGRCMYAYTQFAATEFILWGDCAQI